MFATCHERIKSVLEVFSGNKNLKCVSFFVAKIDGLSPTEIKRWSVM